MGQSMPQPFVDAVAPIHLAIAAHRIAWEGLQASTAFFDATGQEHRMKLVWPAQDAEVEAMADILGTSCGSPDGAEAVVSHLQWYLAPCSVRAAQAEPPQVRDIRARIADLLLLLGRRAPGSSAPIRAAIEAHRAAWDACRTAPGTGEGWDEVGWSLQSAVQEASGALREVPCGNRAGAQALLQHLRGFTAELEAADPELREAVEYC